MNASPTTDVAVVIQARMSSSRFPGKMLAGVGPQQVPLAVWVCRRAAAAGFPVVLATSTDPGDDPLAQAVEAAGYRVFRGSLDDVLARFTAAAISTGAEVVVRITGDCPLVDPDVLREVVGALWANAYASNVAPPSFPDGLDCEVIRVAALRAAVAEATERHEREHVTPFVRERPGRFPSVNVTHSGSDRSDLHWSVDRPDDLAVINELLAETGVPDPRLADLLAAADRRPDLIARSKTQRANEGAIATFTAAMEARAPRPSIAESERLWKRSEGLIPAGTQTLSKGPTQWVRGVAPKYLARGQGSHVWDVDGNEFIDYPMGLGPVTLGHGHPAVVEAVTKVLKDGTAFSLMHPLEITLAEKIREVVPCAQGDGMVRFGKNGSDATSACIRAARAKTGRTYIARHGYHCWQDWSIESTYGVRAKGVPPEITAQTTTFPYNDLEALERVLKSRAHAAIIMEPVNLTPPKPGYLEGVRELATRYGAVLIFDEVITGFRYARGGAQEYFQVTPDLCAMGKGLGNGLPIAVVCGKKEFMAPFDEIFFSFTFGGETAGLAAALATLEVMERHDYWGHVWKQGAKLQDGYRRLAKEFGLAHLTDCAGMPPWTIVTFTDQPKWTGLQMKTLLQQEMLRRGVLFSGSQFLSLSHSDADIDHTVDAYREAMRVLRTALDLNAVDALTKGQCNEVIFRRG